MAKNLDLERNRPSVAEPERKDAPVMSMEGVDSFLSFLESSGRTKQTLLTYRRCLGRLYAFLPDDKEIGADSLRQWMEAMRTEGKNRWVAKYPYFRRELLSGFFRAKGTSIKVAPA